MLTGGRPRRESFVRHLLAEIELAGEEMAGFDTLYLGGGTPSALEPEELGHILARVATMAKAAAPAESRLPDDSRRPRETGAVWTFLEANPEDVTGERARRWRELGVRTLSLGIQSFDDRALAFLGRRHSGAQARRSVELAREAGFDTVSIDLIYGLPGETAEDWRATLAAAVALAPDHLSCYQLTVHEGTPFGFRARRGELVELPEGAQAERFLFTHTFLGNHGYEGYEVSSFARSPHHRSRHNQKYWDHTPYLGLGPSAHSFDGRKRWWNERKLGAYERRIAAGERPVAGSEELGRSELALEALMLGLRTAAGVDLECLRRRYGADLLAGDASSSSANRALLDRLLRDGLLRLDAGAICPTLQGLAVADSLARAFELGGAT